MAAIITRALLEHYLRAAGDERAQRIAAERLRSLHTPEQVVAHWISGEAFRFGLCAAAENCFLRAHGARLANTGTTTAGALAEQGRRLLELAGVNPARWEAARKGGGT